MVHLPMYVALKATYGGAPYKYLGVEDDGKLAYSTDKVVSDRTKFAVEYAGDDGVAHIRSCYNNKYWVRSSESENWIVAAAKDPVEDTMAWNCTLFRTNVNDINGGETAVKYVHVQDGKTVGRRDVAPDREMYLCLEPLATIEDESAVVDYGSIVILPQYVAFKDQNGLYFNTKAAFPIVTFTSDDIGQEGNSFEIFTTRDGLTYLKSDTGNCWQSKYQVDSLLFPIDIENIIVCYQDQNDEEGEQTDPDMLFSIYRVDEDVVALRHIYTNKFLERTDLGDYAGHPYYGLMTTSNNITRECRLQVVEPVLAREVNVFKFHLDRTRIYGHEPLQYAEQPADNPTDQDQETTLQFTYTTSSTSTWNTTKSWAVSMKVTITSGVPFIEAGSVEIGGELKKEYSMGGSLEETQQVQSSYVVKVPAQKRAIVSAMATRGTCDVPYSYDQVDHMPNGDTKTTTLSDGVYTGVNAYHFNYLVRYGNL